MSVLAVALVNNLQWYGSTGFTCQAQVVGINSSDIAFTVSLSNVPATILTSSLQSAISSAVKAQLTADYGVTVGLLDTVAVIGADLAFL
jgi:hypothetical protein